MYVIGTLCGGTCSATFIDIAYYVARELGLLADVRRSVRRVASDPELIGVFTVADLDRVHEVENRRTVVNCWAALRELDFRYQKESCYFATYPDGSNVETSDEPFDTIYIESLRNLASTGFDRSDYNGLAQMCAMSLFTEVVPGLAAKKDESRLNLRMTAVGYLQRSQTNHVRALSSFGLSAFWYPKCRIALAINRYLAVEMCDGWLGSDVQVNLIRDDAAKDWEVLVNEARNSVIGTSPAAHCNLNLQAAIEQTLDQFESQFLLVEESGLENFLVNFPGNESTFAQRLSGPTGDYFVRMSNAEPLVGQDLRHDLVAMVARYFREHTCAATKEYVSGLITSAARTVGRLPNELPNCSQQMDLGLARDVIHGWWAKSLGL